MDDVWGAPSGSGGSTKDPSKQEAYNRVFRQQLTEVLTRYGTISEVWFDGSCVIDVSDLLKQYASSAVIFQGPQATIRWAGTESGKLPYPAWNSLKSQDLRTGVATASAGRSRRRRLGATRGGHDALQSQLVLVRRQREEAQESR